MGDTKSSALVVWATTDHGVASTVRTVASRLEEDPHRIPVVRADLPRIVADRTLLPSLASLVGARAEIAMLASLGWSAIERELQASPARVILAADPLAAAVADHWRAKGLLRAPLVGMVAGLRLDPRWTSTAVDRLAVADLLQAEEAHALGLPAECVVPSGIPVCGGFSSVPPGELDGLRAHFGLSSSAPVVLTVCDGLEPEVLSGALFQLGMIGERATLLFDVARHETAADLLRRRAGLYGVRAQMFGKVNDAPQLWAASTIVVARPHDYVEQRALALRLPLCALAFGSQEQETGRIWVERGIGRVATSVATLGAELELLLEPAGLARAQQKIGAISKRSAAQEIARLVAQVRADSERVLGEVRVRETPSTPEAEAPSKSGPLEAIGLESEPPPRESQSELEAAEAEANGLVREHHEQADRWQARVELARQKGEPELGAEAERRAERHRSAMHRALAELARIADRRRALGAPPADGRVERSFRELEVEEALAALKRKLQ